MRFLIGEIKLLATLTIFFLVIFSAKGEDFNQYLDGPMSDAEFEKKMEKVTVKNSFLLPDGGEGLLDKDQSVNKAHAILGLSDDEEKKIMKDLSFKEKNLSSGFTVPGTFDDSDSYLEFDNKIITKNFESKGKSSFYFYYIKDTFEYKDRGGIFKKTYETSGKSVRRLGTLHIGSDKYMSKGKINYLVGAQLGVGFSSGKAFFKNTTYTQDERSEVKFTLWTIPVELKAGMELNMGPRFKIGLCAGPSIMGLFQSRSDKKQGEARKRRRQVGYGYFAGAKLQLSLSVLPKKLFNPFVYFANNGITKSSINIEIRHQNLTNFQNKDISISGTSFGMGFSFEFI